MKIHDLTALAPGLLAATALALSLSAGAQTPPPSGTPPAAKSTQAAPMARHHEASAAKARPAADMKAACEAMMAKKQAMQEKLQAMDADLDKLVAEMDAARASREPDALEKPMAAVIDALVAQRKAQRSMMMEMQPAMMEHMAHHMEMHGAKGAKGCPMMKMGASPAPRTDGPTPEP